ncbi:prolyl oligopeptidase family serine peptidase [Algoriphagus sp.]|jgi:prolyl oligopeptidase|uniref:prolyl oligopeptidase family serine peptidase n=1 Tax=Algoriphagus sp. TaxID=1872435 RepID=UPI002719CDD8|nr:prolyl oligopeptidase family serine peptidase [Algoriphagus sp.]MDO8966721.1 prolyl oligopeptidase family serine peptidase [Algoriphagus sp.]MDP3199956.1 prolyl oligopeptidase family serine peptidase [Algoriphagus sp.]
MKKGLKIIASISICPFCLLINIHTIAQCLQYPSSPKLPVADTIFGKVVVDEYRWLEDVHEEQTQGWLKMQADFSEMVINKIAGRDRLIKEFQQLDSLNKESIPYIMRKGDRYFYRKTLPGENVGKLYYRQGKEGEEILIFDPNAHTENNKQITYRFSPCENGKKVALSIAEAGNADICLVKIMDVETKKFDQDSLYPVLFSIDSWTPDSHAIIYKETQTDDPSSTLLFQDLKVKYHRLGTPEKEDKTLLSGLTHPNLGMDNTEYPLVGYSADDKYLIATFYQGQYQKTFYAPSGEIDKKHIQWLPLLGTEEQAKDAFIRNDSVYFLTRRDAPNYKLVVRPLQALDHFERVIVPEGWDAIQWLAISKDYLFITKTDGINTTIDQYHFTTNTLQPVNLPFSGSAWIQPFDKETNDSFLNLISWKQPGVRYDYSPTNLTMQLSRFNNIPNYPGLDALVVEEVEAKSHDGTMVPLSIVYNKNIERNGNNVAYLTGYGSYGSSMSPYFDLLKLPLLNNGVIVAIAHVRGGGEKGHSWHMGGFKSTKPNTWKDFIACAEYLVEHNYSSPKNIIGEGTSAGGIMIGRAMTERPELFAVAINNVPVSNPLRGENRPNGLLDSKEFGSAKDSVEALGLIEMDTYLHIDEDKSYPAVLAVTGVNDTRVPFWQPGKLVAKMQALSGQQNPVLLLVNYDSGHWSEEKSVQFRNYANVFAFALWQAGHTDFSPQ